MIESRSDGIPSFHDGSFDGLWIPGNNKVHLFLTTLDNRRFTIALDGVKALHLWNIRAGSIVLDVSLIDTDQLTEGHVESAYELSDVARDQQIARHLESARQDGLRMLEMIPSYGAEGVVLFKDIELSERSQSNPGTQV